MLFFLAFAILLGASSDKYASANDVHIYQSILGDLNTFGVPIGNCMVPRPSDSLEEFSCQCSAVCSLFDTCCADSQYNFAKPPKVKAACRSLDGERAYFMVDRCAEGDDRIWKNLCEEDWNGEDSVMKLVPVTSTFTRITYKNYFCFRCHESNEDYVYWNVILESDYFIDPPIDRSKVTVNYDMTSGTWVALLSEDGDLFPVNLSFNFSSEIYPLPVRCQPELISQCAEGWDDDDVREKCAAYMGIVYKGCIPYRNAHCLLCNFEDLGNVICDTYGVRHKIQFAFTFLLDVNFSDGDEVGKVRRCKKKYTWDPFANKCRKLICALPGQVVRNGKCVYQ